VREAAGQSSNRQEQPVQKRFGGTESHGNYSSPSPIALSISTLEGFGGSHRKHSSFSVWTNAAMTCACSKPCSTARTGSVLLEPSRKVNKNWLRARHVPGSRERNGWLVTISACATGQMIFGSMPLSGYGVYGE
jgi:hypothetical protein